MASPIKKFFFPGPQDIPISHKIAKIQSFFVILTGYVELGFTPSQQYTLGFKPLPGLPPGAAEP
jgi:hypothetical protein